MSAGPDRITVSHELDGWRWEYRSNGRIIGTSSEAYRDRAACLHGLWLVTGVTLDVPSGWRGTQDQGWLSAPPTTLPLRATTDPCWHGLIASIHDWPGIRARRRELARRTASTRPLAHCTTHTEHVPDCVFCDTAERNLQMATVTS